MTILSALSAWLGNGAGGESRADVKLTDESFWRWYSGTDNYSGKSVTQQSALQLSVVWACVRLLAETISTLPLSLYQIDRKGKSSVAYGDTLYGILHDAPNAEMTAVDFWESMLAAVLLRGNGYARKELTGNVLTALTPLQPALMAPYRDRDSKQIVYRYSDPAGRIDYPPADIFHIKGFSLDGLLGLSPVAYGRNSMGAAIAIEEATATTFGRGMRPGGVLEMEPFLTKEQRKNFEESFMEKFAGATNAGKAMLLEGGMKYKQITMNPEDAQMLQSRAFSVEELCRWYRVPPFMIGYTEKTTSWGTGLEQQNIGFLTYALRPYLKRIEQQITRSLIAPSMRATRFAEFNLEGLLRADSAARAALYSSFAQNGVMTRNEIRAKENLAPMDGGDVLTVQVNLTPIDQLGKAAAHAGTKLPEAMP